MDRSLDAQADAFARLLALAPGDPDEAFRKAVELSNGLFPHQIEGVAFLLGRRRAILADDMGLGKTRQAIVAVKHVVPEGPYLVVCPASVKRNCGPPLRHTNLCPLISNSTVITEPSAPGFASV